jgi:hypothetical protein
MKQFLTISFFLFAGLQISFGQPNLVLNPSFELVQGCPAGQNFLDSAFNWYNPTSNTPDLFLSCTPPFEFNNVPDCAWAFQYPNTGNNYAGFEIDIGFNNNIGCEYLGGTLSDSLLSGKKYIVEMYVNYPEARGNAAYKPLSIYFSNTQQHIFTFGVLPLIPQINFDTIVSDSLNWVKLSDTLVAFGGERYFLIGNFLESWQMEIDTFNYDTLGGGITVYYFVDDVSVTMIEDTTEPPPQPPTYPEIKLYPIPSNDGIFTLEYNLPTNGEMLIHDALGQIVGRVSLESGANLKILSLVSLASGVYHYRVMAEGLEQKAGKLVISK